VLSSLDTAATSFVADLAGTYVASLVVNDGTVDSQPSNATIVATWSSQQVTQILVDAIATINTLDPGAFKNENMRNALTNKINAVLADIDRGLYSDALDKLQNDILKKTDGCATSGAPDKNDWITNCADQSQIYPLILQAIRLLRG